MIDVVVYKVRANPEENISVIVLNEVEE